MVTTGSSFLQGLMWDNDTTYTIPPTPLMVELLLWTAVNLVHTVHRVRSLQTSAILVWPCCMMVVVVLGCWVLSLCLISTECGLRLSRFFMFFFKLHSNSRGGHFLSGSLLSSLQLFRRPIHNHTYMSFSCRSRIDDSFSSVVDMFDFRFYLQFRFIHLWEGA